MTLCGKGQWVTEAHALRLCSVSSTKELNSLPNVLVGDSTSLEAPFNSQTFYFVGPAGQPAEKSIDVSHWAELCTAVYSTKDHASMDAKALALFARYAGTGIDFGQLPSQVAELKRLEAVIPPSSLGLTNFLESPKANKMKKSKKGAATVAGDQNVTKVQDGEIYIRADGKKVRRVKKKATGAKAAPTSSKDDLSSFLGGNASTKKKASGSATVSGDNPTKAKSFSEGEIYIRADGKKVRRVKKSSAPTAAVSAEAPMASSSKGLGGFLDSNAKKTGPKLSGSATVTGDRIVKKRSSSQDGEIIIRADGTKVRRVKKTVVRKKSSDTLDAAMATNKASTASTTDDLPKSKAATAKPGLGSFLDSDPTPRKKMSGSATVTGTPMAKKSSSAASQDGEIYIRADGKKVRRVKKKKSFDSTDSDLLGAAKKAASSSKDDLSSFLGANASTKKKASGSATVSGDMPSKQKAKSFTDGEIYIRADGKKVRRVKKSSAPTAAVSADEPKKGLGGFLDSTAKTGPKMSGSATVSGDRIVKKKDKPEGEIIIRADGTKVRRVKKTVTRKKSSDSLESAPPTSAATTDDLPKSKGLGGFLDSDTTPRKKLSGSATVTGAPVAKKASSTDEGEIYIRADGKKVRRVKKKKPAATTDSLSGFLDSASPTKKKGSGSATVSGSQPSKQTKSVTEGEIYIRADGKKVRRVKRTNSTSLAAAAADANAAKNGLGGFLDDTSKSGKSGMSGSATVTGAQVVKSTPEGEIIIRDGKKILRRKKSVTSAGSAVGGEGEVYRRADGKLVRRVKRSVSSDSTGLGTSNHTISGPVTGLKPKAETATTPTAPLSDSNGHKENVDTTTSTASPAAEPAKSQLTDAEEELAAPYRKMLRMGMPEGAVEQKMSTDEVDARIVAAVLGREIPAAASSLEPAPQETPSEPAAASSATPQESPSEPAAGTASDLTEDEEATAAHYRKMIKMGMPEGAVEQKMATDGVHARIVASVFGREVPPLETPAPASPSAPAAGAASQLTEDEEATAVQYRKMLKMGMPEGAVEHKMAQDGVSARIVASVLGREVPPLEKPASESAPSTGQPPSSTAAPTPPAPVEQKEAAAPNAVAYIVTVTDEKDEKKTTSLDAALQSTNGLKRQQSMKSVDSKSTVGVGEKFAVKLKEQSSGDTSSDAKPQTAYMTLDELAAKTGQSRESLEAFVCKKRERSSSPPRFVLQPMEKKEEEAKFLVETHTPAAPGAAPPSPVKPGQNVAKIAEGQEVVDSDLASAARAVSALGDSDMKSLLQKLQSGDVEDLLKKLQEAEKRQKKLEKQLAQSGIAIAEDIDYGEALAKVSEIAKRMNEIGGSDIVLPDKEEQNRLREEYFKLEQDMERYNTALLMTDEYQKEEERKEQKWEHDNAAGNIAALKAIYRHMPVKIRHMSEAELTNTPSPNGKFLPKAIAKKFKRTNVLQCLRLNPDDIERMHPAALENMRVTGLTLTERRALYAHLKVLGPRWEKNKAEKMTERKWVWYQMMKNNFKENLAPYQRHVDQYGPPGNHPYATRDNPNAGCPLLGKQCPLKADQMPDYSGDYGYTEEFEYEVSDVRKADADDPGARAMQEALELAREKKANERADLLKKHYKGKLLQVSKANGSCEAMDETMDKMEYATVKWLEFIAEKGKDESEADKKKEVANFTDALNELKLAVLDFAQRSGMQTSGKKKAGGDSPDIRSSVECSLSEETYECSQEFFQFMKDRMKELGIRDTRVEKTIELLNNMLGELHEKNLSTLEALGAKRSERSRKLKTNAEMKKEVDEKMKAAEEKDAPPAEEAAAGGPGPPMSGRGGRGGLLDAISGGRGRGSGGGRGGLLDAIQGGRGRGKPGRGGGRGGLLDAIQGRGKGRGGGGDGGRGGLMAAIAARGGGGN